ncbi:flagellar assembly protein FliH [Paracoccaceae bacterium]|nr:flagellar assembly protein FliH [Paracoccaceae bacterium]
MNDVQDKVFDDQRSDYADLESLLDVAKSSEFNLSDGFTEEKKEFEKLSSFFEIVTSKEQKEPTSLDEKNEFSNNDLVDGSDGTEEKHDSLEVSKSDEVENLDKLDTIEEDTAAASKEKSSDYNNQSILDDTQDDIKSGDPLENLENPQSTESTESTEADVSEVAEGLPSFSEGEKLAYDMGYKEALEEFEKAMLLEKNSFKDLTDTMFSVGEEFQESLQELIKTKICQISSELLDDEIKEFPRPLLKKIKKAADNILSEVKDFRLELNHADLELLNGNESAESLGFELVERSDLRRGEFRLVSNSTGFQQELSH